MRRPSPKQLQKLTPGEPDLAVAMYQAGKSLAAIGVALGVTRQSVWDLLRVRKVQMRPQRRYGNANHFYRGGPKSSDQAHNKLEKAVLRGKLKRPKTCDRCGKEPPPCKNGRTRIEAHHPDYRQPLLVIWLCQMCHHEEHKTNATT